MDYLASAFPKLDEELFIRCPPNPRHPYRILINDSDDTSRDPIDLEPKLFEAVTFLMRHRGSLMFERETGRWTLQRRVD